MRELERRRRRRSRSGRGRRRSTRGGHRVDVLLAVGIPHQGAFAADDRRRSSLGRAGERVEEGGGAERTDHRTRAPFARLRRWTSVPAAAYGCSRGTCRAPRASTSARWPASSPAQPDMVVLQEVQRRRPARLAAAIGDDARRWAFKHWPVRHRAEGLACCRRTDSSGAAPFTLRRAPFWELASPHRSRGPSCRDDRLRGGRRPPVAPRRRRRRAAGGRRRPGPVGRRLPPVICGDLNDLPGEAAYAASSAPAGPTRGGRPTATAEPTAPPTGPPVSGRAGCRPSASTTCSPPRRAVEGATSRPMAPLDDVRRVLRPPSPALGRRITSDPS